MSMPFREDRYLRNPVEPRDSAGQPDHATGIFTGALSLTFLKHLVFSSLKNKVGVVIPLKCQEGNVYSKACTPTLSPSRPLSNKHALINAVIFSLYAFMDTGTHMRLWQNEAWYGKVPLFKSEITGYFRKSEIYGFSFFPLSLPFLQFLFFLPLSLPAFSHFCSQQDAPVPEFATSPRIPSSIYCRVPLDTLCWMKHKLESRLSGEI